MQKGKKVFTNVLISVGGNRLQLAEVFFGETIERIEYRLSEPVEWEKLVSRDQWKKFQQQVSHVQTPAEYQAVDGHFLLLIPGGIDPHVHFDTPGFEFREDFEHASTAAAFGGVTTIIDMPCTSLPPVTNRQNFSTKLEAVRNRSVIDFAFWGGVSGTDFGNGALLHRQIRELAEGGVAGFKAYFVSGMESFTDLTVAQMEQAARWIGETGLPLAVHAEEKSLVRTREEQARQIGDTTWQAYCQSRDVLAEAVAVAQLIEIARQTATPIHVVHLSSQRALTLLRRAREEGIPITAETCPHYLFFTQQNFENPAIRNFLKTAPPVKFEADREALWQGLQDGTLEFVTTDHAGCNPEEEKTSDDFWDVYGGIPGVEHRVPFLFSEGFWKGRLSLERTIQLLSENPAVFFGLNHRKGRLSPGRDADFALLNLWESQTIRAAEMHSKGRYTPFEGVSLNAVVEQSWVRGRLVAQRGNETAAVEPGYGQFVRRGTG